jgi:hypothetical protein
VHSRRARAAWRGRSQWTHRRYQCAAGVLRRRRSLPAAQLAGGRVAASGGHPHGRDGIPDDCRTRALLLRERLRPWFRTRTDFYCLVLRTGPRINRPCGVAPAHCRYELCVRCLFALVWLLLPPGPEGIVLRARRSRLRLRRLFRVTAAPAAHEFSPAIPNRHGTVKHEDMEYYEY